MNSTENIPQVWDDERDDQFFHLTASLFTPTYCYGASVLLASYDPDDALTATADTDASTSSAHAATPPADTAADLGSRTHHTAH